MKRPPEFWVTLGTMCVIAAIDAVRATAVEIPAGVTVAIAAVYAVARTAMTFCALKPPADEEKE